jgi:hypothetical protein
MMIVIMIMIMIVIMIMIRISPLGQLELWAPSSGVRDVFTSIADVSHTLVNDDDDNKPIKGRKHPVVCGHIPQGVDEHHIFV